MTTVETYLQKAIEADVSYNNLRTNMNTNPNDYITELTKKDIFGHQNFTLAQAKAFAGVTEQKDKNGNIIKDENGNIQYEFITKKVQQDDGTTKEVRIKGYKVIETYNDPNTGYSGTLLKNIETGELILSNRGTEPKSIEDLGDDVTLTRGQVPEQFISLSNFMKKLIDEGTITKEATVTMSGHSLGGTLTQIATAAFEDYIDKAYTYNSPGAKNLKSYVYEKDNKYYYKELIGYSTTTGEPLYSNEQEISQYTYEG